jgi:hypothetical protein
MTTKEIRVLVLLNQTLEESIKNDLQSKIKKAKKGEFDEGGDSIVTHNLKMLKELIFS